MKTIFKTIICFLAGALVLSCNEKEFLHEEPLSFLSPDNAYKTTADFNLALNGLYSKVRDNYYNSSTSNVFEFFNSTDVAKHARNLSTFMGDMKAWCVPQQAVINSVWEREYKTIFAANTFLAKLDVSSLSDSEKALFSAEGHFFRAFAYRTLVYLFGGVPLVLEPVTTPRSDFVRDTKANILEAMRKDFEAAAAGLPKIETIKSDGRLSKEAAQFYLAETYISLGNNQKAVDLLTEVISNPALALMKERFGSHKTDEGDVFWDLFRVNNQNRGGGNTEAIWVIQMETDVIGGFTVSTAYRPFYLERYAAPVTFSLTDPDGKTAMICTNGRSTLNIGGRGAANMCNTDWWLKDLWESDWDNDIRNSKWNIVRDCYYDLPSSKYYMKSCIAADTYSKKLKTDWWRWYPWPSKITTPGDHPESLYSDSNLGLKSSAGATYLDQYMLRLPEVYLLRAEAYLNLTRKTEAAADINVVRSRAKAKPVDAADVTIDYILDERAREMVYEEMRRITLGRLGKYLERTRKCNSFSGPQLENHMELWPIPFAAIEANKNATLTQNPGYVN